MKLCGDAQLGFRRGEACDFTAPNARIASNYLTRCQPDQTSYRAIIPPTCWRPLPGPAQRTGDHAGASTGEIAVQACRRSRQRPLPLPDVRACQRRPRGLRTICGRSTRGGRPGRVHRRAESAHLERVEWITSDPFSASARCTARSTGGRTRTPLTWSTRSRGLTIGKTMSVCSAPARCWPPMSSIEARDYAAVQRALAEAGYKSEKIIVIVPTDVRELGELTRATTARQQERRSAGNGFRQHCAAPR